MIKARQKIDATKDLVVADQKAISDLEDDLRKSGDVNFYVKSHEYGFVEVAHLALCHAVLDIDMGWGGTA